MSSKNSIVGASMEDKKRRNSFRKVVWPQKEKNFLTHIHRTKHRLESRLAGFTNHLFLGQKSHHLALDNFDSLLETAAVRVPTKFLNSNYSLDTG